MQVIYKQANAPLPELDAALRRFQPLLERCIAKDPAARFASATELEQAVAGIERQDAATGADR
jgi:hypothetical protein